MRQPRTALAGVTLIAMALLVSCRSTPQDEAARRSPAAGANLLVISIDTLRADHVPAYGYASVDAPAMSRLAAEGVRFRAAYTPVPLTLPAHVSLFTGLLPTTHGVRDNGGFQLGSGSATLAEILKRGGYATAAFVSAFVLDSRWGLDRGFDRYFDDFSVATGDLSAMASIQRPAAATWTEARRWLEANRAQRFFAWLHLFDPHTPYTPPAPFAARYASRPYDGEIAYVDSVLAQVIEFLETQSLIDTTLVVLVSDHGEGLGDHDEDEHGLLAYDTTLHVPWVIRLPNKQFAGRAIEEAVSLVDMFPTVASLLGVPIGSNVDGVDRSALIEVGRGSTDALYAETLYPRLRMGWSDLTTVRSGEFKYIRAPQPELYNYRSDPRETTNLASSQPEVTARLDRILARVLAERVTPPVRATTPDPQTVKQLQALGYVSGTSAQVDVNTRLPDPKTKTGIYRQHTRARQQLAEGDEAAGLKTLQAVVLADPAIESARRTLREYWIGRRQFADATTWLRSAIARHPQEPGFWRDLALVARAAGDRATARAAIAKSLAIRPDDVESLVVAGEIQRDDGQLDAALASFTRAAARASDPTVPQMQAVQTLIALGNLTGAESMIRAVLANDPNAASAHYLLAQIAEARKDFRTAEVEYRLEIDRNPWEYRARFNLALLVGARGARAEHLSLLQSIPAVAPHFGEVHFYIAKALLDLGDATRFAEAERAAQRGLQLAPESQMAPLGHYVLADIYRLTGRPTDAARAFERGQQLERKLARPSR